MNQGISNFNIYSRVSQGENTFLLSKKAYTFKETHYEIHEIKDTVIGHDNFNISSNTSNFVKIYYNGLIKASCSNGLVTEYLYDAYGNIEKEIIHEQAEPSNIINEITYAYDNVIPLGRENPIYIVQNDERIDFEYHPISKRIISETTSHIQKTYSYDLFQNHVIDESGTMSINRTI
ncbi:hypothetical protein [Acholeplasma granularum]|uniref:hypothetical protein n=1 Tax=Acholeplasma granularum TaxID=264635 RepID=UPI0004B3EF9E|nr:hypothetical protein [Acholeplasma granularum]